MEDALTRSNYLESLMDSPARRVAKKWKKLPKGWTDDSVKSFWKSLTDRAPKHPVSRCIREMDGKIGDPGAFCGGLADEMIPGWRQKSRKEACGEGGCSCGGSCGCGSSPLRTQNDYGDALSPKSLVAAYLLRKASNPVAETILKQMGGLRRLALMVGAKNFIALPSEADSPNGTKLGGVSFQFGKGKFCRIVLDYSDTYTMEFGTARGGVKKTYRGIYNDRLVSTFETETGLYLTL